MLDRFLYWTNSEKISITQPAHAFSLRVKTSICNNQSMCESMKVCDNSYMNFSRQEFMPRLPLWIQSPIHLINNQFITLSFKVDFFVYNNCDLNHRVKALVLQRTSLLLTRVLIILPTEYLPRQSFTKKQHQLLVIPNLETWHKSLNIHTSLHNQ